MKLDVKTNHLYIRSGAIYCMKRDYLIRQGRRYGGNNSRHIIDDKALNIINK